jgi:hypothetical protein
MSVAWRISVPPAMAGPSTAAMSGFVSWNRRSSGLMTEGSSALGAWSCSLKFSPG